MFALVIELVRANGTNSKCQHLTGLKRHEVAKILTSLELPALEMRQEELWCVLRRFEVDSSGENPYASQG